MSRRRALVATLVGVPLACAAVLAAEIARSAGRTYLETPDYAVRADVAGADPPLRLAVLGDSTVAGVGSATAEGSLVALVAERVGERLGRRVLAQGHGVSGARTADLPAGQVPELDDPDVVLVVIGSNDVTHVASPAGVERSTEALLTAIRERTGAPVVLGGIPRFQTVPAVDQPLRLVVDTYARVLRERQRQAAGRVDGALFVDLAAEASPRFLGRPEAMSSDGFHPSPVGYGFWADALAPAVARAAVAGPPPPSA